MLIPLLITVTEHQQIGGTHSTTLVYEVSTFVRFDA